MARAGGGARDPTGAGERNVGPREVAGTATAHALASLAGAGPVAPELRLPGRRSQPLRPALFERPGAARSRLTARLWPSSRLPCPRQGEAAERGEEFPAEGEVASWAARPVERLRRL